MKLSILIPVYNEEKTLETIFPKVFELEKSPLIDELEIIAVDDCSKDNSLNLLKNMNQKVKSGFSSTKKTRGRGPR